MCVCVDNENKIICRGPFAKAVCESDAHNLSKQKGDALQQSPEITTINRNTQIWFASAKTRNGRTYRKTVSNSVDTGTFYFMPVFCTVRTHWHRTTPLKNANAKAINKRVRVSGCLLGNRSYFRTACLSPPPIRALTWLEGRVAWFFTSPCAHRTGSIFRTGRYMSYAVGCSGIVFPYWQFWRARNAPFNWNYV